ncbi:Pro-Pol polyprotein [Dictyocoela muelleri]|nr:Pro-Pol polyprotein [Dictyocoela muelleri]
MSKTISIKTEEEKNNMLIYITSKKYPDNFSKEEKKKLNHKSKVFSVKKGILYIKDDGIEKVFVCKHESDKKKTIIKRFHDEDHAGIKATFNRVRSYAYGITYSDVSDVLKSCVNCLREIPPLQNPSISPIVPHFPRERLIVDTIDMRIYSHHNDEYKYIFTFIDSFTKFGWAYISKRKDSESFSKILLKHFYTEGLWSIFHTDNGTEFVNSAVHAILEKFNIASVRGMPYHPQSQGQIERFNRTIKERLRKVLDDGRFDWISHIDNVVFHYNNTKHTATGCKPFVLFKGFDIDSNFGQVFNQNNTINNIQDHICEYVDTYRREYNIRQYENIEIGSIVMLARPYNLKRARRNHVFESIYYPSEYSVIGILDNKFKIQNITSGEIITAKRRYLKFLRNN